MIESFHSHSMIELRSRLQATWRKRWAIYRKASPLKMLASFLSVHIQNKKGRFLVRNPLQLVSQLQISY